MPAILLLWRYPRLSHSTFDYVPLKAITYESFCHKSGYELFVTIRSFADALALVRDVQSPPRALVPEAG